MDYSIVRSAEEIDELLDKCSDGINDGTLYPGISYEQGIQEAIYWLTGFHDINPMEE